MHVRISECCVGGGGEIGPARTDADHHVGATREPVRGQCPGRPDRPQVRWMVIGQRSLAGLRLPYRNPGQVDELPQRIGGLRIDHATAGHDHRPIRAADHGRRAIESPGIGLGARHVPGALLEKCIGVVVGFRLDILWERERYGSRLSRVCQDAHRFESRWHHLLGAGDSVPVAGDRLETVVDRGVASPWHLELLQDRVHGSRGEDIARKQQDGQTVDGGQGRTGDHVGSTRSDRAGAGHDAKPVLHSRVADCGVDHGLLVARLVVGQQVRSLVERLADAGHVAMAEDSKAAVHEAMLGAVALDVLCAEKSHQRLRHR